MITRASAMAAGLMSLLPAMAAAQPLDSGVVEVGNEDAGNDEAGGSLGGLKATIGLAFGFSPDYEGSENLEVGAVPIARFGWADHAQYVSLEPEAGTYQLRVNVLPEIGLELGPLLAFRGGRKNVENNDVNRLPNTDDAWEAGGFLSWRIPVPLPGRRSIALEASGAADISGAHEGWWVRPAIAYRALVAEGWRLSAHAFADYANGDYMEEFFTISPSQSSRSGLRQYDADAGWKDVGTTLAVEWQFAEHWVTGVSGTYKRMIGDAGSSPVTRSAGSKNQGSGGMFVAYRF